MVGEAATATDTRHGVGVRFGRLVEEFATEGRVGGVVVVHGRAETGDGWEDALDDVDAAFVEGSHRDGLPGWKLVAKVAERG